MRLATACRKSAPAPASVAFPPDYAKPHKSLEIDRPQAAIEEAAAGIERYPRERNEYDSVS